MSRLIKDDIYKRSWEGLSTLFDEYIDLHYKGAPVIDTGSNYDVYCKVLSDLIEIEKQKKSNKWFLNIKL